jgi:hypothetical protein
VQGETVMYQPGGRDLDAIDRLIDWVVQRSPNRNTGELIVFILLELAMLAVLLPVLIGIIFAAWFISGGW